MPGDRGGAGVECGGGANTGNTKEFFCGDGTAVVAITHIHTWGKIA